MKRVVPLLITAVGGLETALRKRGSYETGR